MKLISEVTYEFSSSDTAARKAFLNNQAGRLDILEGRLSRHEGKRLARRKLALQNRLTKTGPIKKVYTNTSFSEQSLDPAAMRRKRIASTRTMRKLVMDAQGQWLDKMSNRIDAVGAIRKKRLLSK